MSLLLLALEGTVVLSLSLVVCPLRSENVGRVLSPRYGLFGETERTRHRTVLGVESHRTGKMLVSVTFNVIGMVCMVCHTNKPLDTDRRERVRVVYLPVSPTN